MQIKVKLDENAVMPTKAHDADAGFDLYAPKKFTVDKCLIDCEYNDCSVGNAIIDTGVHIAIPKGYVGMIKSKSGLNVKHDLTAEGVIDSGYTGSIVVKLYNHGSLDYDFRKGDKIAQLVILPIPEVELVETDTLDETERGNGGFGSSGR